MLTPRLEQLNSDAGLARNGRRRCSAAWVRLHLFEVVLVLSVAVGVGAGTWHWLGSSLRPPWTETGACGPELDPTGMGGCFEFGIAFGFRYVQHPPIQHGWELSGTPDLGDVKLGATATVATYLGSVVLIVSRRALSGH